MSNACTPRIRYSQREAADRDTREKEASDRVQRIADAERASLDNPDRPSVLHPEQLPEKLTVRIVYHTLPGAIIAETGQERTSWTLVADNPEAAMAGAEVALAALGYTLDRFRLYADMSLMVGTFYRKDGPYAAE